MAPSKPKRLYQAWKGSNRFLCGGRMIFGPDVASLFLTTLLIGAPALAFCYQVFAKIRMHHQMFGYPVLIVGLTVTILDIMFLFLTSARDPGIVPRNLRPPESLDDGFDMNNTQSMEWVSGRTPHLKLPRTRDVFVNGHSVKVKFCDTCLLYRPPRASHCSICNNCVQKFDHHCPWVGQCIGLRNYRFFFLFISSSTFLCLYVFTFSWINLIHEKHKDTLWRTMSREILSVILIAYCFIAVWFVGGLTVFHSYLMCTNQTTYENFRYRYDKNENPHNKGLLKNIKETFFSKIPPSMNDFRAWILYDDVTESECITPTVRGARMSSKEKIDIEMGSKVSEDNDTSLPDILQNLDYSGIEDDIKGGKGSDGSIAFDPFSPPSDHELKDLEKGSANGDSIDADESTEDSIDAEERTDDSTDAEERTDEGEATKTSDRPGIS